MWRTGRRLRGKEVSCGGNLGDDGKAKGMGLRKDLSPGFSCQLNGLILGALNTMILGGFGKVNKLCFYALSLGQASQPS